MPKFTRKISRSRVRIGLKSDFMSGRNLPLLAVLMIFVIAASFIIFELYKPVMLSVVSQTTTTTIADNCVCPAGYVKQGNDCNPICYYSIPKCLSPSFICGSELGTTTTTIPTARGTLVVAIKDEDHKLPGGAVVKSMNFTVTGMEVYSNESGGWISVFDGQKTFDLLKYTTTYAKIAEQMVDAGAYSKIRIKLSDGNVSIVHTVVGIYRPKVYDLAAQKETTVSHGFSVVDGGTLTLVLDFDVENSVKRTGEGYSMEPVISVLEQSGRATNMEEV